MNQKARFASALILAVIVTGCSYVNWQQTARKREKGNIYIEALTATTREFVPNTFFRLIPASDSVSGSYEGEDTRVQFMGVDIGLWRLQVAGNGYGSLDTLVEIRSRCRTNVQVFMSATPKVSIAMCRDTTTAHVPNAP
jgi:hypothetical protein